MEHPAQEGAKCKSIKIIFPVPLCRTGSWVLLNITGDRLVRGYFFPKPSLPVFETGCLARGAFKHTADTNRKEAWLLTTFSFTQLNIPNLRHSEAFPASEPHEGFRVVEKERLALETPSPPLPTAAPSSTPLSDSGGRRKIGGSLEKAGRPQQPQR